MGINAKTKRAAIYGAAGITVGLLAAFAANKHPLSHPKTFFLLLSIGAVAGAVVGSSTYKEKNGI